jgi:Transposase DDE domain
MTGITDFITTYGWQDIFTVWFVLVDDALKVLNAQFGRWRTRGPQPLFSDSEVITVALIADTFFSGDEDKALTFIRQYHLEMFPRLPAPGRFNYRRRALMLITEQVRRVVVEQWGLLPGEDTVRLTDSAPIPVCTYTRAKLNKTIEQDRHLYFGYTPARKAKVFGFKLHVGTSFEGVVDQWLLAPASLHDSQVTALYEGEELGGPGGVGVQLVADGAFNNPGWRRAMRYKYGPTMQIWALPRKDTRHPWPVEFRRVVARVRRRVETALSVLQTVFNIEQPHSRSLSGLVCRMATRLLAHTLCFISAPLLRWSGFVPITRN